MDEVRKMLATLQEDGILGVAGESITLLDQERLLRLTESLGRDPGEPPAG
jgi:hypothetical protein